MLFRSSTLYAATREEWQEYSSMQEFFGFQVLSNYSGVGHSIDNRTGDRFWQRVLVCRKQDYSISDYHSMRRDLWPDLPVSSFQFTNLLGWEPPIAGAAKRQCGRPLLLHPFLHHNFSSGNTQFSFPYEPEKRDKQLKRLDVVSNAVKLLRSLSDKHSDLRKLPAEVLDELRSKGIFASPASKKPEKASFSVLLGQDESNAAEYGQFVAPLEKKWDFLM